MYDIYNQFCRTLVQRHSTFEHLSFRSYQHDRTRNEPQRATWDLVAYCYQQQFRVEKIYLLSLMSISSTGVLLMKNLFEDELNYVSFARLKSILKIAPEAQKWSKILQRFFHNFETTLLFDDRSPAFANFQFETTRH